MFVIVAAMLHTALAIAATLSFSGMMLVIVMTVVVLVHERVPLTFGQQVAVDGKCRDKRCRQRCCHREPKHRVHEAGVHGARDYRHHRVVNELHRRD